jgi:hypothetical protein
MLSTPYTLSPRSSNRKASAEPIKPATPVIMTFMGVPIVIRF